MLAAVASLARDNVLFKVIVLFEDLSWCSFVLLLTTISLRNCFMSRTCMANVLPQLTVMQIPAKVLLETHIKPGEMHFENLFCLSWHSVISKKHSNYFYLACGFVLRRLRSDLLNPKFGSQKSALLQLKNHKFSET